MRPQPCANRENGSVAAAAAAAAAEERLVELNGGEASYPAHSGRAGGGGAQGGMARGGVQVPYGGGRGIHHDACQQRHTTGISRKRAGMSACVKKDVSNADVHVKATMVSTLDAGYGYGYGSETHRLAARNRPHPLPPTRHRARFAVVGGCLVSRLTSGPGRAP